MLYRRAIIVLIIPLSPLYPLLWIGIDKTNLRFDNAQITNGYQQIN